jgi:hypothetical protein
MGARSIITVLWLVLAAAASGTAQYPDKIVVDGETYKLHTNPLEGYFEANPDKRHPREPPETGNHKMSTALWRGYVATFGFDDDTLVLLELETLNPLARHDNDEPEFVSSIDKYFPDAESRICDWYSGLLVLPHGDLEHYVHLGYGSIYEHQLLLRVVDGRIVDRAEMTRDEFLDYKRQLFALFMKTPEYKEAVAFYHQVDEELGDEHEPDIEFTNQFLFDGGGWERFVELEFPRTD